MNSSRFWLFVARAIARRPWLVDALIAFAKRTPYFDIRGVDDELYMGRWWLLRGRPAHDFCPWWLRWLPKAARIHHIAREDLDRDLHDHPFDFRSIVLRGWYVEQDIYGVKRLVNAGDTYVSRAERFHRIDSVSPGGVWTLFILGTRRNGWGFLVGGRKVAWREYLNAPESAYRDPYPQEGAEV
jgi:hypothetical protein